MIVFGEGALDGMGGAAAIKSNAHAETTAPVSRMYEL
jgi:hypothetical protein